MFRKHYGFTCITQFPLEHRETEEKQRSQNPKREILCFCGFQCFCVLPVEKKAPDPSILIQTMVGTPALNASVIHKMWWYQYKFRLFGVYGDHQVVPLKSTLTTQVMTKPRIPYRPVWCQLWVTRFITAWTGNWKDITVWNKPPASHVNLIRSKKA